MDLYLVTRGNEQWYCPPDQVGIWAAQGCTVYALTPTRVAGPEQGTETDADDGAPLTGEASTNGVGATENDTDATTVETQAATTATGQGGNQ